MKQLIFLLALLLISFAPSAHAVVHMDLQVKINMAERKLEISGTASKPVTLPVINKKETEFSYVWFLPEAQNVQDWSHGNFASKTDLYLPSGWHPETDELVTFNVQVLAPLVTILPGAIEQESQTEDTYQARFIMDRPTEGIPLFAGPYKISQLTYKETRLRTYFYEGMEKLAQGYLERTAKYLNRFEQQIGLYPFAEFNIIAAPIPAGYGFAGLTYMGARVLHLPFIKETSLGHEILHNYWGNGVFPDYEKGNWAEGLTTYMADYMTAEMVSKEKAKDMRLSWLRDYNALPSELDTPVTDFVSKHSKASQVIGYHKVAFIFHMLRNILGDQTFFDALRALWKDKAFQTASWQDLEDYFSKAAKRDLSFYFKQWVYQAGAPEFKNISARAQRQKGMGWDVTARVMQAKPFYETYLPVAVGTGDAVLDKMLYVRGRLTPAKLNMEQRPFAISLDPDFEVFRKLGANEAPPILRDVMLAKNVQLIVASDDKNLDPIATQLARRLNEGQIKVASTPNQDAFILIGTHEEVAHKLSAMRLPPAPLSVKEGVTALVWADKTNPTTPYMVVSVKDTASLQALLRPLPHYGKRSQLMLDGRKAVFKSNGQTRPISVPVH
ncbi:Peptidase M1, membrane alanine aminopeptidase (fragment) [Candidatus Terasakiella magnetica]|uniref:Peptidase M1, membrane alanine aminopeptidase n=1 Tax=Candidatus Terasakiella magnetica TaxID=1867952 RepID=A0A1C3RK12_9PROT